MNNTRQDLHHSYIFNDDYKEQFKTYVADLCESSIEIIDDKMHRVQELNNAYIQATGERPDHIELDRLSTWMLKGKNLDEARTDEGVHNFKSDRQLRRIKQEKEFTYAIIKEVVTDDGNYKLTQRLSMD